MGERTKRLAFALVALGLLVYLGRSLLRSLASPEERIRHAIEDAIDAFNDRDLAAMKLFAKDYRDEDGFSREELESALLALFWGGEGPCRAIPHEEQWVIDVSPDATSAEVSLGILLLREADTEEPWWELHALLDLEQRSGRWKVISSREVNHSDRRR